MTDSRKPRDFFIKEINGVLYAFTNSEAPGAIHTREILPQEAGNTEAPIGREFNIRLSTLIVNDNPPGTFEDQVKVREVLADAIDCIIEKGEGE